MNKLVRSLLIVLLGMGPLWGQSSAPVPPGQPATSQEEETARLRREVEQLKQAVAALQTRLAAQDAYNKAAAAPAGDAVAEVKAEVKDLDKRVTRAERDSALNRVKFTGDYRFETHSIWGDVPAHFDGMKLQNLVVKSIFSMGVLGRPPASVAEINNTVASHFGDYQFFTQNLTFAQLKQIVGQIPAPMQQQLFGMLMPSTFVGSYTDNNKILYTNRFRLNLQSNINDNLSVTARLSMYKVFGDSTGVQVFNGQPNTLNLDGTTAGVPNSDMLRVERAYFTWNKIGGSKFFLSIGRRPSTDGPPLHLREDELRGGTPSGALIDYQFDGVTFGYHLSEKSILRFCYGLGYESGFGNGNLLKLPQDRLKDVHFMGANLDLWSSDNTLIQLTLARAFDVTDGFNGLVVLPNNPLTGDPVSAPVVMRFTPSANLGNINLAGLNVMRRFHDFDLFVSGNYTGLRPNGITTPFGGLVSDPFDTPRDRDAGMIYAGIRYNVPKDDGATKVGFEFNRGSKYWFNFAQAADDLIMPKTNTRGNVYETYLTHRINSRFILKGDLIHYDFIWSGSGWHLGAPKRLDSTPTLGFPTYDTASQVSVSLIARF